MTTPTLKADSYANAITGLAGAKDKSSYGFFLERDSLQSEVLSGLYEQDAIAARVVDRVVDDATREGFFLTGEDEAVDFASVQSELEDLDALNAVADAWRWARLYGGALLIMVVNDGGKMDTKLNLEKANKLSSLQVIESQFVTPVGFNPGLGARAFRRPEWYEISGLAVGKDKETKRVHRSRVIRFDGVRVAPNRMIEKNGWGPSVLDRIYTQLDQLGQVMGYARAVMHDISIQVYKLDGLREQLCGSDQSQAEMRAVMETIRMSVDNLHVLALDTADDFVEVNRSVAGLKELIDKFVDALVRATPYTRGVLLGESPGGLNANGESETRTYLDWVASQQKVQLTPVLNELLTVLFAVRGNRGEIVPDEWTVNFHPLWQPTAQESADTFLKKAQASQILALNDVISSDEWREALISEGLIIPGDSPPDVGELEEEEEEETMEETPPNPTEGEDPPPPEDTDEDEDGAAE
jgi:phage-related protein (TIGR01555 family)